MSYDVFNCLDWKNAVVSNQKSPSSRKNNNHGVVLFGYLGCLAQ